MMNRKYISIILFCLILLICSLLFIIINQKNKLESYIGTTEAFLIGELDHTLNDISANGDKIITTQQEYNRIKKELININNVISTHKHLEFLSTYIDEYILMEKAEDIKFKDLKKLQQFIYFSLKSDDKTAREYYKHFKNNQYITKVVNE